MIYSVIYWINGLLGLLQNDLNKEQRNIALGLSAMIITCFQALRWTTGTDWLPYLTFFDTCLTGESEFEFGFTLMNKIIRQCSSSYTIFLLIECGLTQYCFASFAKWSGVRWSIVILLSLFAAMVFPIRYTLACGIILCSYRYVVDRKLRNFLIFVFIAFSIHRTAILFLPIYWITRGEWHIKKVLIIYVLVILVGLWTDFVFKNSLAIAATMFPFLGNAAQSKLLFYMDGSGIGEEHVMTPLRFLISILNSFVFILLFYWGKKKYYNQSAIFSFLFNAYIVGMCWNRIFVQTIPDFARLTSFFTGGFPIMALLIIEKQKTYLQPALILLLMFYYFVVYIGVIYGFYQDLMVPYISIFDGMNRIVY